nr:hypothetical protein [Tanacetum cinerariifolium]
FIAAQFCFWIERRHMLVGHGLVLRTWILEARDLEPEEGPVEAGSSKMAPKKRTTRETPATTTTPTTTVTDAQLQALIDRGVAAALVERDADRSRDGDNSHGSRTGERRAVGQDVAYVMLWTALKRMITDKYCPSGEIKKLESEY